MVPRRARCEPRPYLCERTARPERYARTPCRMDAGSTTARNCEKERTDYRVEQVPVLRRLHDRTLDTHARYSPWPWRSGFTALHITACSSLYVHTTICVLVRTCRRVPYGAGWGRACRTFTACMLLTCVRAAGCGALRGSARAADSGGPTAFRARERARSHFRDNSSVRWRDCRAWALTGDRSSSGGARCGRAPMYVKICVFTKIELCEIRFGVHEDVASFIQVCRAEPGGASVPHRVGPS